MAFRPKQQPGATQDRAEQLGLGLATGDPDWDPSRPPRLPEREREVHAHDLSAQLGGAERL